MKLIEAIKSGKPFKRPEYKVFHVCGSDCSEPFTRSEVLAEDWEIEEEKIQFTRMELINGLYDCEGRFAELIAKRLSGTES